MDAFSIMGIAVLTCVLAVTVKQFRPELAMQVSIAGGAIVTLAILSRISGVMISLRELYAESGLGGDWFGMIVKIAGTAYITQIASELCRDPGEGALAVKTELCGRILMLASAMPALVTLLRLLAGLADGMG